MNYPSPRANSQSEFGEQRLSALLKHVEEKSIRFVLTYETGRFIPGEFLFDDNNEPTSEEFQRQHIKQGRSGWRIEVDMASYQSDDGDGAIYPTLGGAIDAGIRLLREVR